MKHLLYSTTFLLIAISGFGQAPLVKQWDYRYGGSDLDYLTVLQQTPDEGYILGGSSASFANGDKTQPSWGGNDYWIVKIDSLGIKQWDKRYGGSGLDWLYCLQQTTDHGYILGGHSSSGISGDKTQASRGSYDYWVVKIDSLGIKQWDKRFGGADNDMLHSLQQSNDGGYLLGGFTESDSTGDMTQRLWNWQSGFHPADYWIVKIDSLGNKLWDKRFGGLQDDELYSLQNTADKGYLLGGRTRSGIGGDKTQSGRGVYDFWFVKVDSIGNKQWDKRFGGNSSDWPLSLESTSDGGYITGGTSQSGLNGDKTQSMWDTAGAGYDHWIVKFDSLGNKQWDKRFGGILWEDEYGNVLQTKDGGYLSTGTSYSPISGDKSEDNLGLEQIWIVKTDSLGAKLWDKIIFTTGHEEIGLATQAKDGCYVIANRTEAGIGGDKTQPTRGGLDYWIIKFCDTTQQQQSGSCQLSSINVTSWQNIFCEGDSIELMAHPSLSNGAQILDQSQTVYNGGTSARTLAGYREWQSFTAGITGTLTQIDIGFFTLINGVGRLSIYAGSGTGGALLWQQNVNVVCGGGNCTLPFTVSAPVVAGQIYTFEFVPGLGMPDPYGIQVANPGTYSGGEMHLVDPSGTYPTGFDMVFNTYVSGGSALTYLWSTGSTDTSIYINAGGEYFITVTESSNCTAVDSITISEDVIALSLIATATTCGNHNGSATVSITGGIQPIFINWSNGSQHDTILSLNAGIYSVSVSDSAGCSVTASTMVNFSDSLSVTITIDKPVICSDDSSEICAPSGLSYYQWNVGSSDSCIMVNTAGSYYVTVTDNNGCTAESNHLAVVVHPISTVTIAADTNVICASDSAFICAPTIYLSYNWNNDAQDQCITTNLAGNYYVTVTDANGCTAESNRIAITVLQLPPVSISVNGDTLTVNNSSQQQWYLNGSAIIGATANTYIATQGGSYTVMVTDSNGCTATSSPVIISGIDNITEQDIVSVYPNPLTAGGWQLTVGNSFIGAKAEVFDADGRIVFQSEIRNPQSEIAPDVPKGVYLLRITSGKSSVVRKLVRL